ncbi:uncharacterized protein EV422DRAFT_602417 [Fimicolochytrium jonesii]|uniref:uncharacterized protein n=1 Tax=Fimicolochytrium jonesii TaxID=1396493 RepID=UPI0022FE0E8B|nr:uncharacterized protein EV422DRAFT_602417 [Fimicolochytrium jonesii]KAI8818375.1 hypothetical protein EV422DRAFT_602417 [Fimicolochytrium jonesii]
MGSHSVTDSAASSKNVATVPGVVSSVQEAERSAAVKLGAILASGSHPFDFTDVQMKTLQTVLETYLLPADDEEEFQRAFLAGGITGKGGAPTLSEAASGDVEKYATAPPSQFISIPDALELLGLMARPDQINAIRTFLTILSTPISSYIVTGVFSSVLDMSEKDRVRVLRNLRTSRLGPLRNVAESFKSLAMVTAYGVPLRDETGNVSHPLWKTVGYQRHPKLERPLPDDLWRPTFVQLFQDQAAALTVAEPATLHCDVVIVGSGAGGGLVAAELTKEGYNVIVLEKGRYNHPTELSYEEADCYKQLYEAAGGLLTEDGGIRIAAGSTFGGGTFVNWSASLRLPYKTREEWAKKYDLPYFTSDEYNKSLDAVCSRLGVGTDAIQHNIPNSLLMKGCQKLGMPCVSIPQNTAGKPHTCGFCGLGCPYGEKQGAHVTYLRDAAETGKARFVENCEVEKIQHHRGRATGVEGKITDPNTGLSRKIIVKAKKVVSSAGSINTPALLLRSGFRNPNIGKHLRLHPVSFIFGVFRDRTEPVNPWSGSIMTALSTAADDIHEDGYGAKLEIPTMHPALFAMSLPFYSPSRHRAMMANYHYTVPIIALCRDSDSSTGTVTVNSRKGADGTTTYTRHITYNLGSKDQLTMAAGVEAALKLLIAAGATQIFTTQPGLDPFDIPRGGDVLNTPEFAAYIDSVRRFGFQSTWTPMICAHQMGSCRIAGDAHRGACDPHGRTWEMRDCYVADASLFPTASGVNPMITTYSLAYMVAQTIKKDLQELSLVSATSAKL